MILSRTYLLLYASIGHHVVFVAKRALGVLSSASYNFSYVDEIAHTMILARPVTSVGRIRRLISASLSVPLTRTSF